MNFELLHRSEVLSNYPHTGPQASEISATIKAYGHVARATDVYEQLLLETLAVLEHL